MRLAEIENNTPSFWLLDNGAMFSIRTATGASIAILRQSERNQWQMDDEEGSVCGIIGSREWTNDEAITFATKTLIERMTAEIDALKTEVTKEKKI